MTATQDRRFDVMCVGLIVADHVCAPIREFPPPGCLITTEKLHLTIGGCSANASTDLARLGLSVALSGYLGNDPMGDFVLDQLQQNGVNCESLQRSEKSQTSTTMVINVANEDRRFIHAVGANTELTGLEVPDEVLQQVRTIAVGGIGLNPQLSGKNVRDLFERAHRFGVTTLLDVVLDDVQLCQQMLVDALPATDIFLPNSDEARLLTGSRDVGGQIQHFLDQGAANVVITDGAQGATLGRPNLPLLRQPAFRVKQVDGTGGGDAFLSGFLYGLLKNCTDEECLLYGAAMGASCVQHPGATTGVFNAEELEAFVAKHRTDSSESSA